MESTSDTLDAPLNPLIEMLSHAIKKYESQDKKLMGFVSEAKRLPADIALLQTLMSQFRLTGAIYRKSVEK